MQQVKQVVLAVLVFMVSALAQEPQVQSQQNKPIFLVSNGERVVDIYEALYKNTAVKTPEQLLARMREINRGASLPKQVNEKLSLESRIVLPDPNNPFFAFAPFGCETVDTVLKTRAREVDRLPTARRALQSLNHARKDCGQHVFVRNYNEPGGYIWYVRNGSAQAQRVAETFREREAMDFDIFLRAVIR